MAQATKAQLAARIAELEAQNQALNTQNTALRAQLADAERMLRQQIKARNIAERQVPAQANPEGAITGSYRALAAQAKALAAQGKKVLIRGSQLVVL